MGSAGLTREGALHLPEEGALGSSAQVTAYLRLVTAGRRQTGCPSFSLSRGSQSTPGVSFDGCCVLLSYTSRHPLAPGCLPIPALHCSSSPGHILPFPLPAVQREAFLSLDSELLEGKACGAMFVPSQSLTLWRLPAVALSLRTPPCQQRALQLPCCLVTSAPWQVVWV